MDIMKVELNPKHSVLRLQGEKDIFEFLYDGTVLHNDKEIGKNQELIDEMLKFFKKAMGLQIYK